MVHFTLDIYHNKTSVSNRKYITLQDIKLLIALRDSDVITTSENILNTHLTNQNKLAYKYATNRQIGQLSSLYTMILLLGFSFL